MENNCNGTAQKTNLQQYVHNTANKNKNNFCRYFLENCKNIVCIQWRRKE